ncbi:MAG: CHASE domain-containing protein [Candidatus Sericytochromatia bacterium]|nr:CHASE domain-containing protein [Candidatus Sericytochromatia bacterium]
MWPAAWPEATGRALLVGLLAATGVAAAWVGAEQHGGERAVFDAHVRAIGGSLAERMARYEEVLVGVRALLGPLPRPTARAWAQYTEALALNRRLPGIQGLGLAVRMQVGDPAGEAAWASWLADQGRPGWRVWPTATTGAIRTPIVLLEPLDARNRAALGFDMYAEAVRRAALLEAWHSGEARMTGRVTLKQEIAPAKQAGFLLYLPCYRGGGVPASRQARREALVAFAYCPFRADDLFGGVLHHAQSRGISYRIYDGPELSAAHRLTTSEASGDPAHARFSAVRQLRLAGRTWTLQAWTQPGTPLATPNPLPVAIGLGGTALSLGIFALLWSLTTARARALGLAEEMTRELRQADRAKDDFLSVISHELRTPLNFITGFASLLEDEVGGPLTPTQRSYLARIDLGATRMLALVNDLLDLAKIRSGKFEFHRAPVALGPLLTDALTQFSPLARAEGVTLELATNPGRDLGQVIADPQRVAQVIANLLANALKFTPSGGAVRVTVTREPGWVRISVQDTGIGIPPEDLERLFQPFSQVDMSATRRAGGSGLGLSICKALVEGQGGRLGVTSTPGVGSTFWFALPSPAPGRRPGPAQ